MQNQALEQPRDSVLRYGAVVGCELLNFFVKVLACEDLIIMKLLAARLIDQADVVALLQANLPELDVAYLVQSAQRLQLMNGLTEIWNKALPDEPAPNALA